ncbi:hypothetical protein CLV85_1028 [Salinibacterium amurskyense]|uniref:Uncharacterized protein n=2 Tax=Salinibacterium amurskyense TaxID=205941 RepID=A0A2M9D803_9MICO|nr:hypothetical protein CLV85_1028 [Salinibacterium amurskyense]
MAAPILQLRADASKCIPPCRKLPLMSLKKLLAAVASVTLTAGALFGVSAPAFADDALPAHDPAVTQTTTAPSSSESPSAAPVPAAPQPVVAAPVEPVPEPEPEPAPASAASPAPVAPTPAVSPAPDAAKQPAAQAIAVEPSVARSAQPEQQARPDNDKKVWVCKFVSSDNSPSGYQLKSGKQPIHVSVNALGDDVNDTGSFNDRQPSFVVASDDASLCSYTEVIVDEEVTCPTYQYGGIVNITTTTKLFYGTTQVSFEQTQSTRQLTADELRACNPPPVTVYVCQFVPSDSHPSGWVVKAGAQPVLMLESELGDDVNDTGDFDATTPSFIVASDDSVLCASNTEERSTEVRCPSASNRGFATITIVHSYFYGSTKVDESTAVTVRDLTAEEIANCPEVGGDRVATAVVSFEQATCNAPQRLILGPVVNAVWGEITDPEGPADYSVTATATNGAQFPAVAPGLRIALGSQTLTFSGVLNPQLDPTDPECDLVTLGLVMPAVSFAQASCSVGGTYTLGVAAGYDPALVTFTVNGVPGISAGTYPVTASGSVLVTTQVVEPNGLELEWSDPPAFAFAVPSDDDCISPEVITAELPTLAYTGSGGVSVVWWLLPASMIVLGGAAVFVRRRMEADAR